MKFQKMEEEYRNKAISLVEEALVSHDEDEEEAIINGLDDD